MTWEALSMFDGFNELIDRSGRPWEWASVAQMSAFEADMRFKRVASENLVNRAKRHCRVAVVRLKRLPDEAFVFL